MQSFLDTFRRPVVLFDVTNEDHRMHMAAFLKNNSWAKCPYAFYAPMDISVKAYATETLVAYYLNQEFSLHSDQPINNTKTVSDVNTNEQ